MRSLPRRNEPDATDRPIEAAPVGPRSCSLRLRLIVRSLLRALQWCAVHTWLVIGWLLRLSGIRWIFRKSPISGLIVATILAAVLAAGMLRERHPQEVLVVSPFEVPQGGNGTLGVNGRTLSNLLVDEIGRLALEANQYLRTASSLSPTRETPFVATDRPLETPVIDVQVEGVSLKGVLAQWERLRQHQRLVSGDLFWGPTGAVLRVRMEPDLNWEEGPFHMTTEDLRKACRTTALQVLSEWDPKIAGVIYQENGDLHRAAESYQRWVEQARGDTEKAQAYFQLGVAFDLEGQRQAALANYSSALTLRRHFPEALANRGFVLQQMGQIKEAIADYESALHSFKKDDVVTLVNLGNALDDQQRYDEAASSYRRAIQLVPQNPYIHYNLAVTLRKANRQEEAKREFAEYNRLRRSQRSRGTDRK